jgi:hypothetical protein
MMRNDGTGQRGRLALAALTALTIVTAVLVSGTSVFAREPSVPDIVDRFINARNRGDVDATVALFADDATVTQPDRRIYTGAELRWLMQQGIFRGESILIANRRQFGDYVSWEEHVRYHGSTRGAQARAIIRDGRIKSLAYGTASPLEGTDAAVSARTGFPALTGLGTVASFLVGTFALLLVSTRPERGFTSPARRRALMPGLRRWSETHRAVRS